MKKLLLDESVDFPLSEALQAFGHNVTTIANDYTHVLDDADVLTVALREQRILITNDIDLGESIRSRKPPHAGIIAVPGDEDCATKATLLNNALQNNPNEDIHFWVITRYGVWRL
jgi:predicted nuclease of predicted toxin-antitoxin system